MTERPTSPLWQLTLARFREFYREPAAVFWVYGFPLILTLALGIAFREKPIEVFRVDLRTDGPPEAIAQVETWLKGDSRVVLHSVSEADGRMRLRSGETDLVVQVMPSQQGKVVYELWQEPNRTTSALARYAVQTILDRNIAPNDLPTAVSRNLEETGTRYIDFLIPGLLGMGLMGGGLWGVGFVIVDMRVRKLLKRFLATPMRRSDFLLSIMLSRLMFTIPDVLVLLGFGYFLFGVAVHGSFLALLVVIIIGAASFAGLGLLIACRAKTIESISGLMNLVMLPMWILSGVFFKASNFPDSLQPVIQALPLTALNNGLRAIMLDGKTLADIWSELLILASWGVLSFAIALRYFRWR